MEYYSTKEIAAKLMINEETVRRWIRDRKLKAEDLGKGKGYKVSALDLENYINQNKMKNKGSGQEKFQNDNNISVSTLHIGVPIVGGVAAGGLVSEIIQGRRIKGIADHDSEMISIQIKKYELEKRKIEIEALLNSLRAELSLIEHELNTASEIWPQKRI